MRYLPKDEWLDAAKALHVGESKRIWHGAETRTNLLIRNTPEAWSAWCFHCNAGGYVRKHAVPLQAAQAAQAAQAPVSTADSIEQGLHLQALSECSLQVQRDVTVFLQSKGCSAALLGEHLLGWDSARKRIVIAAEGCVLGRALYASSAKWFCYRRAQILLPDCIGSNHVVVVEDLLSALKLHKVLGVAVLALAGTRMQAKDLLVLQGKSAVLHLDADAAGVAGRLKIQRSLQLLQIPYKVLQTAVDPKELRHNQIRELYGFIYTEIAAPT